MHRHHSQPVSRTLALGPELIASAAEKSHISSLGCSHKSVPIHKSHHQNFPARGVLRHRGQQATHLFEIQFPTHCPRSVRKNKKPAERYRVSGPKSLRMLLKSSS